MRAIGKGSLASILAVGLHVTRIILWVALAGVSIAIVLIPFVPFLAGAFSSSDHANISGELEVGNFFEVTHAFVNFGVMLFVVNRLLEILKTLRLGSPFVRENADRFRSLGFALLIGEGAKFAFGFLSLIFDADIDIDFSIITWLAIVAVLVLAEVFREGARMKEEQDLTV